MAVKKVLQIGDPLLKTTNSKITDFDSQHIYKLVLDLSDTMRKNDLKIFITEIRKTKNRDLDQTDELRVYINPEITDYSPQKTVIYEACGSVLHGRLFGPVSRPQKITIQAKNLDGTKFRLTCDGILSRVIQHEYDHMDGIEFLEKISDAKKMMSIEHYQKTIKMSKVQRRHSRITIKEFPFV